MTAAADWPDTDPHEPLRAMLAAEQAARSGVWVVTRDAAMTNSVVNRARDLVCGTVGCLPLTRVRDGEDLGPGWLARPDPFHTAAWFQAWVTDDLFFRGLAYARVTVRDTDRQVLALEWMPWVEVQARPDGAGVIWYRSGTYPNTQPGPAQVTPIEVPSRDVVVFESPLVGVLNGGREVLTIAARLQWAADRFAGAEIPAGVLKQTGGEPTSYADALKLVSDFEVMRRTNTIAYINESLDYHESTLDPSRLQLVEARTYQDAATARLCNVPAFTVGVGIPNESMTYKTALTARLDLLDFGLQPFLTCWEQTMTAVLPRGTEAVVQLEGFLRTSLLATTGPAELAATPPPQPVGGTP